MWGGDALLGWISKHGQFGVAIAAIGATLVIVWRHFSQLLVETRAPVEQWEKINEARLQEIKGLRSDIEQMKAQIAEMDDKITELTRENIFLKARLARYENGNGGGK